LTKKFKIYFSAKKFIFLILEYFSTIFVDFLKNILKMNSFNKQILIKFTFQYTFCFSIVIIFFKKKRRWSDILQRVILDWKHAMKLCHI